MILTIALAGAVIPPDLPQPNGSTVLVITSPTDVHLVSEWWYHGEKRVLDFELDPAVVERSLEWLVK